MNTFEGYVIAESPKAIRFWGHYWWAPIWLPKSQIIMYEDGKSHIVKVKPWLCDKRGLREFHEHTKEELEDEGH